MPPPYRDGYSNQPSPGLLAPCLRCAACGDDDAPAEDAGTDPGSDATTDDASTDPGEDTSPDVGVDTTPDAGEDTSRDVGEDATPDAGEDVTPDAGEDTTPDVDEDTTLDVVEDTTLDVGEDTGDVVEDAADVSDDATDAVDDTTDVTPDTSLDADAGDTGEVIITPVERSVDEDGARIETEAATLQIPPEALTTEVAVTIDNAEEVTLPPNVEPAGAILEFGPPGTVFERPVRITMRYDGSPNTVIWWSNQDGPGYSPLSTVFEGDTLSAWVTHFSEGFPGRDVSPLCADVECSGIPSICVGTTLLERGDATCSDGVCDAVIEEYDGNGDIDCDDVACVDDPACLTEDRCDNGFDDDFDGLTNCDDPDCAADPVCDCPTPNDCGGCGAIEFDGDAAVTEGVGEGCVLSAFPFPEAGVFLCTSGTSAACFDPETLPQPEVCGGAGDEDGDGLADCDDPECSDAPECCLGNACGGCSPLPAFPGESCGEGVYVCDGSEAVTCTDLCFGVTCDGGAPTCLNDTLTARAGTCVEGVCEFEEVTIDCADGGQICADGACVGECADGTTRGCYDGDPATLGVGACRTGFATCVAGGFAACEGQVLPSPEFCGDEFDNDCDGLVDCEDPDCADDLFCGGGGVCGDGEVNPGEECDDGNGANGDGCSSTCQLEPEDCFDGVDNTGNGLTDCDDPDCADEPACGACEPGTADCNDFAGDGCETAIVNNDDNCGGCGISCGAGTCEGTVCFGDTEVCDDAIDNDGDDQLDCEDDDCIGDPACPFECPPGFEDCNGDRRDGCEANLFEDAENCGGCGFACAPGGTCVGGSCE